MNIPFAKPSPLIISVGAILIAMISLQTGSALAKSLIHIVGAPAVTLLRLCFSSLILCLIFRPWRLRFARKQLVPLVIYGLSLACMNFLFYNALLTIPLGIAVGLEFTGPLTLALLTSRRLLDFIWIIVAASGLWFLLRPEQDHLPIDIRGALCALGAGAFWALYIISGQRTGSGHGPATVAVGTLIGSLFFAPVAIITTDNALWQWSILPLALLIALLAGALPFSLEMVALTRLPARVFSTMMSLEPAVATVSGLVFLNERLTSTQYIGLMAVIIASAGTAMTLRPNIRKLKKVQRVNRNKPLL